MTAEEFEKRILELAECPTMRSSLEAKFPEVFASQFKAGDWVEYKNGHEDGPFIVMAKGPAKAIAKEYGTPTGTVHIMSMRSGLTYSPSPSHVRKILKGAWS